MTPIESMSPEETMALGDAAYAIACASMPELAYLHRSMPDIARKIWLHGWLSGRKDTYDEMISKFFNDDGAVH